MKILFVTWWTFSPGGDELKIGLKWISSAGNQFSIALYWLDRDVGYLAQIPLTIFWLNSKFDQIFQCSGLKCTLLITTKFCTCHDSVTVVMCAKFRCDQCNIFQTRALPILVKFWIRSKYRLWDGRQDGSPNNGHQVAYPLHECLLLYSMQCSLVPLFCGPIYIAYRTAMTEAEQESRDDFVLFYEHTVQSREKVSHNDVMPWKHCALLAFVRETIDHQWILLAKGQ